MIRTSEKFADLPAALHIMQSSGLFVETWRKGDKGKYAKLHDVVLAMLPALNQHKIGFTQFPGAIREEGTMHVMSITTRLFTASGEWMEQTGEFPLGLGPVNRDGKLVLNPNQAHGSGITYARRQALLSALGMTTGDDKDADELERVVDKAQSQGPKAGNFQEPEDDSEPKPMDWQSLLDTWRDQPAPGLPGKTLGQLTALEMADTRKNYYLLDAGVVAEMADWTTVYMQENDIEWGSVHYPETGGPWPRTFYDCTPAQVRWAYVHFRTLNQSKQ